MVQPIPFQRAAEAHWQLVYRSLEMSFRSIRGDVIRSRSSSL
jgi:hypothetical protein